MLSHEKGFAIEIRSICGGVARVPTAINK